MFNRLLNSVDVGTELNIELTYVKHFIFLFVQLHGKKYFSRDRYFAGESIQLRPTEHAYSNTPLTSQNGSTLRSDLTFFFL